MELTVLGSGTCDPSQERGCAGYLLKLSGKKFLIDAGPGSFRQLMKMGISLASIDSVFITHFHIDHINDLPAILFSMKNCLPENKRDDLTIHGPDGFADKWEGLMKVYGKWVLSDRYTITVEEHLEDNFEVGSIKVSTLPMEHGEVCIGYRFDDSQGKSLVYSGDTAPCSNIIKLATGCDALLMECTQPESAPKEGHTTTLQAGAVAKKAGVKTLFLTHISPANDTTDLDSQVSAVFDGVVIAVRDGMRVTI